jgi:hypothetical protein
MADMIVCSVGIREFEPVSLEFSLTAVFRVLQSGYYGASNNLSEIYAKSDVCRRFLLPLHLR